MIKNKKSVLIALTMVASLFLPSLASATQLKQTSVRLGRLATSANSGGDIYVTFKLNTAPTTVAKIRIVFPVGFTVANGTPTVATTGYPLTPSATAPPGTLTAAASSATSDIIVSGLTSASLNNTTLYGFIISGATVTNPASAGQYTMTVNSLDSSSALIDSTPSPTYITGASPNDQVNVTASVAPNFSFSLSATSDTVPQVDSTNIKTSPGVNMVVGTNSPLGYTAYVKSSQGSLTSATNPGTPITTGTFDNTPDSLTAGTTNYTFVPSTGAACSSCVGSLTYNGEYAGIDASHGGAFNGTNFASFVSRNGYTNADTVNFKERITVANTVGYANDYTDTLTIVAAGNY